MQPDTIRLSQKAKDRLVVLKRRTGIEQWNILCRWALCRSLQEPTEPSTDFTTDSNIEIAWSTFAGEYAPVYQGLLEDTCPSSLDSQEHLLAHIHRGIGYLFSEVNSGQGIAELLIVKKSPPSTN